MSTIAQHKTEISELIDNWVVWRDAGFWDRFATVWHSDGWMAATWFQGPGHKFVEVSRTGFEKGVSILHFQGAKNIELNGKRAIAQTKMTISQRACVDGELVDVLCTGRFYDFIEQRKVGQQEEWRIVRRQPIYEKDRMDLLDPGKRLELDQNLLTQFPHGYRHLAYLQTRLGFTIKKDMPELTGSVVQALYKRGQLWLSGDPDAFDEPPVETTGL